MSLTAKQREVLTLIGLSRLRRDEMPSGHGITQALAALVSKGLLTHDPLTDSYWRSG